MTVLTRFLVSAIAAVARALLAPVAKSACSHILAGAQWVRERWKQRQRARRSRRECMRSLGDWIESIRLQFWFREFATGEMKKTLEDTDRDLSHAHGIPYWKLNICERMGWTVTQFDSLPVKERCAWEEYFRRDEDSRLESVKRSWKRRDKEEVARFLEYRERMAAARSGTPSADVAHKRLRAG